MKRALSESIANHFPDYNLDWVLRVDASDKAVGAVLYQERPSNPRHQISRPTRTSDKRNHSNTR